MKKLFALVLALALVFTLTATVLAQTNNPPIPTGDGQLLTGNSFGFPGGIVSYDADGNPGILVNGVWIPCPVCDLGMATSYYATGAVQIRAYSDDFGNNALTTTPDPFEVCFVDPGVGAVKFYTNPGWQIMPTYITGGFRCTITHSTGIYAVIAEDWQQ